jgi:hypothetical protein
MYNDIEHTFGYQCHEVKAMIEEIGEPIDVVAVFSCGRISPLFFSWRNRRYGNLQTASTWSRYEGDAKLVYISVTADNANLYELMFHTRNLRWDLVKIYHE